MVATGAELFDDPLFKASRMRVRGYSAPSTARELKMTVDELDRAILAERPKYRQFIKTAQGETFAELGWECMHILKTPLRDEDGPMRLKASETYMRF